MSLFSVDTTYSSKYAATLNMLIVITFLSVVYSEDTG